jgi:hypothetical protein
MYRYLNDYLLTLSFWLSQPCDDADFKLLTQERELYCNAMGQCSCCRQPNST